MFKINVKVTVNRQQCQSIQTIFFRCEPQIGFQLSQCSKRTLSFVAVVTGLVVNIGRTSKDRYVCISLADSNTPKVLYGKESPLWRSQYERYHTNSTSTASMLSSTKGR